MQTEISSGAFIPPLKAAFRLLATGLLLGVPCNGFSATVNQDISSLNCIHLILIISGVFSLLAIALLYSLKTCRHTTKSLREKEKLFQTVADFTYDWEFWTAPDGNLIYTSPSCERITGYCADDFRKDHGLLERIVYPDDYDLYKQSVCHERSCFRQFRIMTADSETRWVEHLCRQMRDFRGHLLGRRSTIRDITDRKVAEEKLLLAQYAIDSSSNPVGMATMDGTVTYANPALLELFGYSCALEMLGKPFTSFLKEPQEGQRAIEALKSEGKWQGELLAQRNQGSVFELEVQAFVTRDTSQRPLSLTAYFSDVTSKKASEREIRQFAYCDALTGLPNRIALKKHMDQALKQASLGSEAIAVCMLDLDDFKQINDTSGHAKGDELLIQLTSRFRKLLNGRDTLARLGGDEFVLVLTDVQNFAEAAHRANEILTALSETPFDLGECQFYTSASIGIALFPQNGRDSETLLKHADMAMYEAKKSGRNTYRFFTDEIHRKVIERHHLEAGLRRAIRNEEFFLVYQPQVDLRSGEIIAVEALVRWQHPETGVIAPGMFIPVAEETGLIHAMGDWILRTTCHQAMKWRHMGLPPMRMAVNLSAQQFRQPGLVERIEQALELSGLEPHFLELEITESVFMENLDNAIEILVDLKMRGVQISIDDFGTGYSSLSYLKNFPIDRIKIAQDFVRDIPADKDDAAIVETIMVMADRLGLKVIAEGVETEEQMMFLHQRGCFEMQGYYFARPMPVEKVEFFLSNHNNQSISIEQVS
jgi:diguanylate cyclase (GGDEF)-like protein/PAS domain S-box-containing protein